jgi:hypothetical protein
LKYSSHLLIQFSRYTNRVLNYRDIAKLEDHILDSFEGEVYIPSDEEISTYIFSDPVKDPVGSWNTFIQSQLNGKTLGQIPEEDAGAFSESDRDKFILLIMLRLMVLYRFELFLGVMNNPLP